MNILMSGASGTLGLPLARTLLERDPDLVVTCVVRSAKSRAALEEGLPPALWPRLEYIEADLSDDASIDAAVHALAAPTSATSTKSTNCIDPGTEADGATRATVGVHLAADVAWDKTCDEMHQVNVQGTRNFARLLLATSTRPHMVYVSTAYTQMKNWEYRTGYEESKAMAERLVRQEFGERMPISTFSCSLVVGDSRTGEISRFHGVYPLLRFLSAMHPPFLVGNKEGLFDIIPLDWTVSELHAMVRRCAGSHTTTECVAAAGPNRIRYEDLVRTAEERIALARRRRALPVPDAVPILRNRQWTFLKRALVAWQPPGISLSDFRFFEKMVRVYGTYAESAKVRAPLNVSRPAPDPHEYLPTVIDYWIELNQRSVMQRTPRGASGEPTDVPRPPVSGATASASTMRPDPGPASRE